MELRHLRYFVAAAEAENVSRAALKLHVSQPALSRQIHDLEDELGFPLFERSAKSVHLTPAGRAFLAEARQVLHRAELAVSAARAVALSAGGELHVGYAPSPTARILPPTLRAFQPQLPGVRVKLHDLSTEEMINGMRESRLDLAFIVRPSRAALRGLHFETLLRDAMCLAVAPGHPLAHAASVTTKTLIREPLIIFSRKEYPEYYELLESLFAPLTVKPRVVEEHDSSASLITAIESGAGIAVVPQSFSCSAGQRLILLPFSNAVPPLVIGALWKNNRLTPAAQLFVNCAKKAAATLN